LLARALEAGARAGLVAGRRRPAAPPRHLTMRRTSKVKVSAARIPLRKSAATAATARRDFPAWIDAGERGVSFSAAHVVMPRVRDGLVLGVVSKKKRPAERNPSHGSGAR